MSIVDVIARPLRQINDVIVSLGVVNTECVLYRYEGIEDPDTSTPEGIIAHRMQQAQETESGKDWSDPIVTQVALRWEDTRKQANKLDKLNAEVSYGEDVPILAKFRFDDHVTRGSYIKVPLSLPNTEDNYDPASERNDMERLEVNGITVRGNRVVAAARWQLGIKRSEEDRAPSDDDILDDVPEDEFFDD